jgi:bifunctional DNA-binding transcriptional regulator/antitoxin component of YhaV-PrlF toxin-antitoxin module
MRRERIKMNEKEKIGGKVTSWGVRIQVPAPVIKGIGLEVGDEVEWQIEEVGGKKAAILMKKEVK